MSAKYNYINLSKLENLCRKDNGRFLRYLYQFSETIPLSIIKLEEYLKEENRTAILQEIHFMLPQLLFFGFEDFKSINEKNSGKDQMTMTEIHKNLSSALLNLKKAINEVDHLIKQTDNKHPK